MQSRRLTWTLALAGFVAGSVAMLSTEGRVARAQPKAPVVTPAPQAPTLTTPANLGARPGDEVELVLTGTNLADPAGVLLSCPAQVSVPADNKNGTDAAKLRVKVKVDPQCPPGLYTVRAATKHGASNARPFVVDPLPPVAASGANRSKDAAQAVPVPCVASGSVAAETSDFYKVKVAAGQKLAFEVLARRIGSPLDPIVVLHDAKTRRELIDLYADDTPGLQGDCRLAHTFKEAGEVLVEVRDTTHRGGGDYFYRLRIGDFPGATTAFPLAAERGKEAKIGFAGPETIPATALAVPKDAGGAVYAVPSAGKDAGWPVPVLVTDHPQITEQEPNDDRAKANTLPVPGGASGRFDKPNDVDHFAVTGKKGQKLAVSVSTFEVNSPAEVLVRVLDAKGAEVARSNPAAPANRFEFTPAADGEYVLACEHQNFLHGPNEVYLLTVAPAGPDFAVALALDRAEAPAGGATAVMATVTRLNGYAGPVDLSIDGGAVAGGKATLPAGQTVAFVPLEVKAGTKPGAYPFRVKGTIAADGATVTRYGTLTDAVKANLGGIPNPPAELLDRCAVGVTDAPPFALKATFDPAALEKGKAGKIVLDVTRGAGADGDIALAPLLVPPTVVPAVKPVAKGQAKGEIGLTVQAGAAAGPTPLAFRATTKVGGKDFAVMLLVTLDVTEPKKEEPKKPEPKKEEAKKPEPKKEEPKKDKK
ncbi:hypothetical protein R5W23_003585 [Gemmata sp. JC673]|uniref:Peptidase C-terminal archaeal/bacterial domain-containing protein n=1 Tax=Gemmata algarum TaxID=2975278 RepID=A0ABU5F8E4_9BACT|nr:hypothetical protein [Gemmata algarum]MDY3562139.1 hypothetical protein [Gemmata algarum]